MSVAKRLRHCLLACGVLIAASDPAQADSERAPEMEDLFLLPGGKGDQLDAVYLRLLCQHISDTPRLRNRYRHVFIVGPWGSQIQGVLRELATLRDELVIQNSPKVVEGIKQLTDSATELSIATPSTLICSEAKTTMNEPPLSAQKNGQVVPITAILTSWRALPGDKAGLQFERVRIPLRSDDPIGKAQAVHSSDSGYVALQQSSVAAGVETLISRLLRRGDEPLLSAHVEYNPSGGRCAIQGSFACMLQPGDMELTVTTSGTDFLSPEQIRIDSPLNWTVARVNDDTPFSVDLRAVRSSGQRAVARLHFHQSGRYKIRVGMQSALDLGTAIREVTEITLEVNPQGMLVDDGGGADLSFYLNPVAVAPFTFSPPGGASFRSALAATRTVPGSAVRDLAATLIRPRDMPGISAPEALSSALPAVVSEDEVRRFVGLTRWTKEQTASADRFFGAPIAGAWFGREGPWCSELAHKIWQASDGALLGYGDLSTWRTTCVVRVREWFERLLLAPAPSRIRLRREESEADPSFVDWIKQEIDITPDQFSVSFSSKRALAIAEELKAVHAVPIISYESSETLALSTFDGQERTSERKLYISEMSQINLAFRGGFMAVAQNGTVKPAGLFGLGVPFLWSVLEPEARLVPYFDGTVTFESDLRVTPWCGLSYVAQAAGMLSWMCRRFDVGVSLGYSLHDKALAGVDARTRLGPHWQVGLEGRIYQTSRTYSGGTWVGLTL